MDIAFFVMFSSLFGFLGSERNILQNDLDLHYDFVAELVLLNLMLTM